MRLVTSKMARPKPGALKNSRIDVVLRATRNGSRHRGHTCCCRRSSCRTGAIAEGVDNKAGSSDLPVGRLVERGVESLLQKYFGFHTPQITSRTFRIPPQKRGVS